jgi:RNA polymerase sigma factor (sigma-70 family)
VFAILRVKCVDPTDHAQQVQQETWRKLWQFAKHYDGKRGFDSWLGALARNASIDHINKCETRTRLIDDLEVKGILGDGPVENAESRIVNQILLHELWEKLAPEEQTLATLAFIQNYENKEIGQMLGVSEAAIKVRRFRLIRKLQKLAS